MIFHKTKRLFNKITPIEVQLIEYNMYIYGIHSNSHILYEIFRLQRYSTVIEKYGNEENANKTLEPFFKHMIDCFHFEFEEINIFTKKG